MKWNGANTFYESFPKYILHGVLSLASSCKITGYVPSHVYDKYSRKVINLNNLNTPTALNHLKLAPFSKQEKYLKLIRQNCHHDIL